MRRRHSALLALATALCMGIAATVCGCGVPADSPAPGTDEVAAVVAEACPNEGFELVSVEETSELPQQVVYTLRSTERDLTFTATSEVYLVESGLFPSYYDTSLSCDYSNVVRGLYYDDVVSELSGRVGNQTEGGLVFLPEQPRFYVSSYEQLEEALRLLEEVDPLYEPELAYNPAEWVRKNASSSVGIRWFDGTLSAEDGRPEGWEVLGSVGLYGALDAEEELDQLARAYAQLIVNKDAPDDPTLPDEFREDLHRTTIERITVHGAEVPFALGETSFGDATNPYQRSYISHGRGIVARWSEAQGCYLVRVDMGGADPQVRDESGSWLVQQVAGLAGGTYEDGAGYFAWSVNDMDGRMEFLGFEDGRNAAQLELNGQTNRISCDASDASIGDAVEMPVDDFAALFGLTARVDEAAGVIELV